MDALQKAAPLSVQQAAPRLPATGRRHDAVLRAGDTTHASDPENARAPFSLIPGRHPPWGAHRPECRPAPTWVPWGLAGRGDNPSALPPAGGLKASGRARSRPSCGSGAEIPKLHPPPCTVVTGRWPPCCRPGPWGAALTAGRPRHKGRQTGPGGVPWGDGAPPEFGATAAHPGSAGLRSGAVLELGARQPRASSPRPQPAFTCASDMCAPVPSHSA